MNKNTRLALNLAAIVVGMALLTAASVPLYRLFCQMTGYGGTPRVATAAPSPSLSDRVITVRFNADTDPRLPWKFTPDQAEIKVRVGESALAHYTVVNDSHAPVAGHAVYNVLPFKAGPYFLKIECFCFQQQTLAAGQTVHFPVSFVLDADLLKDAEMDEVHTITLSYTFFQVDEGKP
jgi:cytochrome c oxidase assembly protein subunit 11